MLGRCVLAAIAVTSLLSLACDGSLVRQYEYEEELFLDVDGSATIVINASVPALVAFHGAPLDVDPRARFDRSAVRRLFESSAVRVAHVSQPWRREGRRFVQVRLEIADLNQLSDHPLLGWSTYDFRRRGDDLVYRQTVGAPAGVAVPGLWKGDEVVAFRMHLPSRIEYHNAPSREVERGNILVWEQALPERLDGVPVAVEVRIGSQSILFRTLWVFAGAFAAAVSTLGLIIWLAVRGRESPS